MTNGLQTALHSYMHIRGILNCQTISNIYIEYVYLVGFVFQLAESRAVEFGSGQTQAQLYHPRIGKQSCTRSGNKANCSRAKVALVQKDLPEPAR